MLIGRLGLDKARIPHADRHGLVFLDRGRLEVEDGCLRFVCAGGGALDAGDYQVPHQSLSILLLGPGSSVTHDALRGFLGSVMLEASPGVYVGPRLSKRVRERIWSVLEDWHGTLQGGSIVMIWRDTSAPGELRIQSLGEPPKDIAEHEGALLVRRAFRSN